MPVRFEYTHPTALTVAVAGTFNNWQPDAKLLHSIGEGRWLQETALAPGTYEYCLVVDGQWLPDPQAKDFVPNPFGGVNSVLEVAQIIDAAPVSFTGSTKSNHSKKGILC